MHALVTGGAGFIGSHLVDRLLRENIEVRVLDNFSTGRPENLKHVPSQIELIKGDIRDCDAVRNAMQGIDVVFHEAALCSVARSIDDPQTSNAVNVDGILNVLRAARDEGVKRLVFASSSSVYGNNPALPKQEIQPPAPASPYAVTKYTGELYCNVFYRVFKLETICLRYFNVFGPRQMPDSQYAAVIPKFISSMLRNEQPVIYGDGKQTRDFSYVDNVVEANLLAAKATTGFGEAYNVACGESTSLIQLVDCLKKLTQSDVQALYREPRAGDVIHSFADFSKAKATLNYSPNTKLAAGLEKTVDWHREYKRG